MSTYSIALNADRFDPAEFLAFVGSFVGAVHTDHLLSAGFSHAFQLSGGPVAPGRSAPILCVGADGIQLWLHFGRDNGFHHGARAVAWMMSRYRCHGFTIDDDFPAQPCDHDQLADWVSRIGLASPYLEPAQATRRLTAAVCGRLLRGVVLEQDQIVLRFAGAQLRFSEDLLHLGPVPVISQDGTFVGFNDIYQRLMVSMVHDIRLDADSGLQLCWPDGGPEWHLRVSKGCGVVPGEAIWWLSLPDASDVLVGEHGVGVRSAAVVSPTGA